MSMDFTKDRLEMEAREAKVRDWLDKLDAERKAEQAALDAAVAAEQARLAAKEAFSKAKEAILGETEFAGYGFTNIFESVKSIADAPPEAPDASDEPEMGCDEAEAVEAVLSDLEGGQ